MCITKLHFVMHCWGGGMRRSHRTGVNRLEKSVRDEYDVDRHDRGRLRERAKSYVSGQWGA